MRLFRRKLGNPLYVVDITLDINNDFVNSNRKIEKIGNLGDFVKFSRENLEGVKIVTHEGYIVDCSIKDYQENSCNRYPRFDAVLDLNSNDTEIDMKTLIEFHQKKQDYGDISYGRPVSLIYSGDFKQRIQTKEGKIFVDLFISNPLNDKRALTALANKYQKND